MRALTVVPGRQGSAELTDMPEPAETDGDVLVQGLAIGICGTDAEIISGAYGEAPAGSERLVLGHESFGRVIEAPPGAGVEPGDLVAGVVRRPDPVPCPQCAAGEWDFCRNGQYTERGIKARHGYASERWRVEHDFAVRIDPSLEPVGMLLEPTSVVAKAWEQIERIAARSTFRPVDVLVTGAGPIGLLAAMLGVQRGHRVHVLDHVSGGPKPGIVADLGAEYYGGALTDVPCPDVVIECTGVGQLVIDAMSHAAPDGIVCLTGVSAPRQVQVDAGSLNKTMVLENNVVFGSVNANRRHWEAASEALAHADLAWLRRLVSRRVPMTDWKSALERQPDDVKVVLDLTA